MADFQFYQTYGAAPGIDVPQGTGNATNDWDFKADGSPGVYSGAAAERIRAGDFSYHVYVRGRFSQPASGPAFSSITNVKYYCSLMNLSGYGAGAYILASGTSVYAQPSAVSKSGVWPAIPTAEASGIEIGTSALEAGTPGYTKWVGIQLKTSANSASAGLNPYQYFTVVYDEI